MTTLRRSVTLLLAVTAALATIVSVASPVGAARASSDAGWKVGTKLIIWTYGSNLCVRTYRGHDARLDHCRQANSELWKVRAIHTVHRSAKFSGYQLVNQNGVCLAQAGSSNKSGTPVHGVTCDNAKKDHRQLWCVLLGETDAPLHSWIFFNARSGLFLEARNSEHPSSPLFVYNQNHAPHRAGKIFGDRRPS